MQAYDTVVVTSQDEVWDDIWWGVNTPIRYGPYAPLSPTVPNSVQFLAPDTDVTRRSHSPKTGSWSKIKKSGSIVMNPHSVSRVVDKHYLAGRARSIARFELPNSSDSVRKRCYGYAEVKLVTNWTEQGDYAYWSTRVPEVKLNSAAEAIRNLQANVRSRVSSDFVSGFDLLTELTELRENVRFIKSVNDGAFAAFSKFFSENDGKALDHALKKRINASQLLRSSDRALRNLGSAWMTYRYVIMPLVYSYRDITKIIEDDGILFKSFRSKERVTIVPEDPPPLASGTRITTYTRGTIEVRGTIKAGYTRDGLQSLTSNSIGLNPLTTAWESIPLSFVVDWFVNVGDYINANTSADFSAQSMACLATKVNTTTTSMLEDAHFYYRDRKWTGGSTNQCFRGNVTLSHSFANDSSEPLRTTVVDSYERSVFKPRDVDLVLAQDPMNWKRSLDAAVISYSTLRNLLKRKLK